MEATLIHFAKTFGLGLLIGFLAGFFLRKGLKFILVLLIILGIILFISGLYENLMSLWSVIGDFMLFIAKDTLIYVWEKSEVYVANKTTVLGFIVGFLWSLFKK